MKRTLITLSIIVLCSLLLVGIANAGNPAYSLTEYGALAPCTVDGRWTSADEWTDAPHTFMAGNTTGKFAYDIDFNTYGLEWIIEILTDNTNDAGDYWQVCFDDSNGGGAAPQVGDFKLEITGHTTLKAYQGTGSGWSQVSPDSGEITWANTIGTSMWSSTPHWILEVVDSSKTSGVIQIPNAPPTGMMVAAFDAATNQYTAWGTGAVANVPDSWGVIADYQTSIPEGFSLGVVVLLSSVAVLLGFYILRKRPKTAHITSTRL